LLFGAVLVDIGEIVKIIILAVLGRKISKNKAFLPYFVFSSYLFLDKLSIIY